MNSSYLIVGLGNPGSEYEKTRHNIGFVALDYFADVIGASLSNKKWQGIYCKKQWQGERLFLLKPETYMNRSGECVSRFREYFKIPIQQIIVIHDDLDLPPGRVKITAKGGAGGHNGVRSIINHLGTPSFIRIKVGIGRPSKDNNRPGQPIERYVLSPFRREEWEILQDRLEFISTAIQIIIQRGADVAMNRMNADTK